MSRTKDLFKKGNNMEDLRKERLKLHREIEELNKMRWDKSLGNKKKDEIYEIIKAKKKKFNFIKTFLEKGDRNEI